MKRTAEVERILGTIKAVANSQHNYSAFYSGDKNKELESQHDYTEHVLRDVIRLIEMELKAEKTDALTPA